MNTLFCSIKFLEKKDDSNDVLAPIPIDIGFKKFPIENSLPAESETCVLCKMAVAKIDQFIADPNNDVSISF